MTYHPRSGLLPPPEPSQDRGSYPHRFTSLVPGGHVHRAALRRRDGWAVTGCNPVRGRSWPDLMRYLVKDVPLDRQQDTYNTWLPLTNAPTQPGAIARPPTHRIAYATFEKTSACQWPQIAVQREGGRWFVSERCARAGLSWDEIMAYMVDEARTAEEALLVRSTWRILK